MNKYKTAAIVPIVGGIILLVMGLLIEVPGGAITTDEDLNGASTTYYIFDSKYSAIDKYINGDAYNYIIGASLVAGKMAGTMISRSVFIAAGVLSICAGLAMLLIKNDSPQKITGTIQYPAPNADLSSVYTDAQMPGTDTPNELPEL